MFRIVPMLVVAAFLAPLAPARQLAAPRLPLEIRQLGEEPELVSVGDLNSDGRDDLVVASRVPGRISILLGDGFGGFSVSSEQPSGKKPVGLPLFDLNGDGELDVVVLHRESFDLRTFLGDGFGHLQFAASMPSGAQAIDVEAADLDGDGLGEVIAAYGNGDFVRHECDAFGQLSGHATWHASTNIVDAMLLRDFTGDGVLDVACANRFPSTIDVFVGSPSGSFAVPVSSAASPSFVLRMAAGDADGDGDLDLACRSSVGAHPYVLPNHGNGAFGTPSTLPWTNIGFDGLDVALQDCDGDGLPELNGGAFIAKNLGGLAFAPAIGLPIITEALAVGSFDGDALSDFAFTLKSPFAIGVMHGDGTLDFEGPTISDPVPTLPQGGFTGTPTDANGDGHVDFVGYERIYTSVFCSFGDASGSFVAGSPTVISTPNPWSGVAKQRSADVTGDGFDDALVLLQTSIRVLQNDGTGAFAPIATLPIVAGASFENFDVGRVDADQALDLFAVDNQQRLYTYRNLGNGTFAAPVTVVVPAPNGAKWTNFVVFDADADGDDDVGCLNTADRSVTICSSNASGIMVPTSTINVQVVAHLARLADVGGDGAQDLIITSSGTGKIAVLARTGPGTFAVPVVTTTTPLTVHRFGVADWNEDGRVDLHMSADLPMTTAIVNGDGALGFGPPRVFAGLVFGEPGDAVDVDEDGRLDLVSATSTPNGPRIRVARQICPGGVAGYGLGCGAPFSPRLTLTGCTTAGAPVTLAIDDAIGASSALLAVGSSMANASIGGTGCSLLVAPPLYSLWIPVNPATGRVASTTVLPPPTAQLQFAMQALLPLATAPDGFIATNGVQVVID
ncbi:MAG: VCBS repeat-containing protein [Planctomycetes bacterium]|nr:VCBS repeat-containing protein [Planctomycetota bacterium]